ncbi:MAG: DUF2213 domain-containing protein [Cetobacterium sp.]
MKSKLITQDSIIISKNRKYDDINKNLHVENNVLTQEGIAPYLGKELTGWEEMGLEPEKLYYVYRSKDLLEKKKDIFNRIQVTYEHPKQLENEVPKNQIVGTTGENPVVELNSDGIAELRNSITFWDDKIVNEVLNDSIKGLSCGTMLEYKKQGGEWNNKKYDIIVSDMYGNHIALTRNPRIKGAVVSDDSNKINNKSTGGIDMNFGEKLSKFFGKEVKLQATKDSIDMIDIVEDLLEKGEHEKAMEVIKKMKETTTELVEPTSDEKTSDIPTKDIPAKDMSTKDEEYITKKDMEGWLDNKITVLIGEALSKRDKEIESTQDKESTNKEIALDCADKLGLGRIQGKNADSMFRSILKSKNVTVYDSMNEDVVKGMVISLAQNNEQKNTHIVIDSSSSNLPSDVVELLG